MKNAIISILEPLFRIYSPTGQEYAISAYTQDFLAGCGFTVQTDQINNIMAVRGEDSSLPLLNAHLDTCQDESDRPYLDSISYNPEQDRFQLRGTQIGCDDKAGLAIIMCLAAHSDLSFKILLTVQEEQGQIGVQHIPAAFFGDAIWAFSLDRKGSSDIITEYLGKTMCSAQFSSELISMGEEEGASLAVAKGSIADTYFIADYCPAVNLSTGYYRVHRKNDYMIVEDTYRMLKVVKNCIEQKERLMETG